jgi:hypothetical protein
VGAGEWVFEMAAKSDRDVIHAEVTSPPLFIATGIDAGTVGKQSFLVVHRSLVIRGKRLFYETCRQFWGE